MKTFKNSREIAASADQVFAALVDPKRLAQWWGPSGFTNTFQICEIKNGGRWSLTMHGPDGKDYPNENRFVEIVPSKMMIVQHVGEPKYVLTITLVATPNGTTVTWSQEFENAKLADQLEHIVVPANAQNLEKLAAEVLGT